MPKRKASAQYCVYREGQPIYFCCRNCVALFESDPNAFLPTLPQFAGRNHADRARSSPVLPPKKPSPYFNLRKHSEWVEQHRAWLGFFLAVAAWHLAASRRAAKAAVKGTVGPGRILLDPGLPVALFVAALACRAVWPHDDPTPIPTPTLTVPQAPATTDREVSRALEFQRDLLKYALLEARGGVPRRIRATYYRGNDERGPELFNGGDYRTVTFHLSLRAASGRTLDYGDPIADGEIFLHVEMVRAAGTFDGFFDDGAMARVTLMGQSFDDGRTPGPLGKRVPLSPIEPHRRWSATYPLDRGPVGRDRWDGVVYFCQSTHQLDELLRQNVHFGIAYHFRLRDGRIDRESHLWMGALFFTDRGLRNWFSHEPIPEIPVPAPASSKSAPAAAR